VAWALLFRPFGAEGMHPPCPAEDMGKDQATDAGRAGEEAAAAAGREGGTELCDCYETGGMRRVHLRRHPNILQRLLVHGAAFNRGLVMRQLLGRGTPRGLQGHQAALLLTFLQLWREVWAPNPIWGGYADSRASLEPFSSRLRLQAALCSLLRTRPFSPRAVREAAWDFDTRLFGPGALHGILARNIIEFP